MSYFGQLVKQSKRSTICTHGLQEKLNDQIWQTELKAESYVWVGLYNHVHGLVARRVMFEVEVRLYDQLNGHVQ